MNTTSIKSIGLLLAGFAAGLLVSRLPHAAAPGDSATADLSQKKFVVSLDEIRQNFAFYDVFAGHYVQTLTMSDGSIHRIELTPILYKGHPVVMFRDNNRFAGRMALNSTNINGTLMMQVSDLDTVLALARADGFPAPSSDAFPILPVLPARVAFQRIPGAKSEAMTVTNEAEQPLNLFVVIFNSGKIVGTRDIPVPAQASSTVEAAEAWTNPRQSSNPPGQGPQPGDQVTMIDIPNQAGSHTAKYQKWRGTVP